MRGFTVSPQARRDLREIAALVAERNPAAAERLILALRETTRNLARFPGLGRARPDIARDVRSFPVGRYLILYRETPAGVLIVRYAHGARRLSGLV